MRRRGGGEVGGLRGSSVGGEKTKVESMVVAAVCEPRRVRRFCSRDNGRRRPVVRCCGGGGMVELSSGGSNDSDRVKIDAVVSDSGGAG